jgi:hypothetical protein
MTPFSINTQHKGFICDTQHKSHSAKFTLSIATLCHYAECCILFIIMLNVIMLSIIRLIVVAPLKRLHLQVQQRLVTSYKTFCAVI